MPGFNFSINIGFDEPANEEKRPIDDESSPATIPWPSLEGLKVKFTLLASIGMVAEAIIALYFILGVVSHKPEALYLIVTLAYCLFFIFGSLRGLFGLFINNESHVARFGRLQFIYLLSALPIFVFSLLLTIKPDNWAERLLSCSGWRCENDEGYMRFVGIHGLVISVLGVPWALFFAFVAKKAQLEIREASRHTTVVDVPPSYETVTAVPVETATETPETPAETAPETLNTQNV